ncbi:MAG TPA: phosphoribosyltransferase, partial [Propionibacterium sp.]|nr:phosphoribosyltransferase [Propionibacterium sp.]
TWVPSLSRPQLVESLATGISRAGRLEPLGPLDLNPEAEPLNRATNSAFRVPQAMAQRVTELDGPVLLVDDLVDSRWTLTVAGRLLRRAGASSVLPFGLASVA